MVSAETQEILDYYDEHPKEWLKFKRTTPEGNNVVGSMCLKHNRFYGSLIILKVNDEDCKQVIHGMPKLHYFNGHNPLICSPSDSIMIHEKLDGSNLLLYPLKDVNGEVLEVVPKSRNTPIAHESLIRLWEKIPQKNAIEEYIKDTGDVLIFELFGYENPHEIQYNTSLDIGLLRGYNKCNKSLDSKQIDKLKAKLKIIRPLKLGETVSMKRSFKSYYGFLIKLINSYDDWDIEGWVLSGTSPEYTFRQLKIKKKEYYEKHKYQGGVPTPIIRKEVYKLFDNNYIDCEDLKEHLEEYINEVSVNLKEEIDEKYVEQVATRKNIKNTIIREVGKRSVNKDFKTLLEELYENNKDLEVSNLMKKFAEEYPFLKNKSRKAYNVLNRLKQKGDHA